MTTLLTVRDLQVGYTDHLASAVCAPVTFTLREGEAVALVGPNGSGKSTVLRGIAGLLPPLAGSVHAWGRVVDEREASFRTATALVMDEDAAFPALTVREHLLLLAKGFGVPQPTDTVSRELSEWGIATRADATPAALSSGQRRRMMLAAAFVRPAKLLILDEPEQRLDAGLRDYLEDRLLRARGEGVAVAFASHDPHLVRDVATHAVVLGDDSSPATTPAEAARTIATW